MYLTSEAAAKVTGVLELDGRREVEGRLKGRLDLGPML
jgi:hypothetical protein